MSEQSEHLDRTMRHLDQLLKSQREQFARLAAQIDQHDQKMQELEERCRRVSHFYGSR